LPKYPVISKEPIVPVLTSIFCAVLYNEKIYGKSESGPEIISPLKKALFLIKEREGLRRPGFG
jgi:hypothetical protein